MGSRQALSAEADRQGACRVRTPRQRGSRASGASAARAGARRPRSGAEDLAGRGPEARGGLVVVVRPLEGSPRDGEVEARVVAARLGERRDPAREGAEGRDGRAAGRPGASRSARRGSPPCSATRACGARRSFGVTRSPRATSGRIAASSSASPAGGHGRSAARRLASSSAERRAGAEAAESVEGAPQTRRPRSAGSSLPPGRTIAPPRKPTFWPLRRRGHLGASRRRASRTITSVASVARRRRRARGGTEVEHGSYGPRPGRGVRGCGDGSASSTHLSGARRVLDEPPHVELGAPGPSRVEGGRDRRRRGRAAPRCAPGARRPRGGRAGPARVRREAIDGAAP